MKNIIIYSTKYGSAAEAAQKLGAGLNGQTEIFNVMKDKIPALEGYGNVILGGSVYIGHVQKQLTAYIQGHLEELLGKKIGLFLCAGAPTEQDCQKELDSVFGEEIAKQALVKQVLGHAFQFEKMRFFDRFMLSKIKGDSISESVYDENKIKVFVDTFNALK